MENASKALIIAGAILISILLISIGIMVINSAQGLTETASKSMDKQTLDAFNAQFTAFEGDNVRGAVVRDLYTTAITSNASYAEYPVTINGSAPTNDARNAVKRSGSYTVDCETDETGRITNIKYSQNGGSSGSSS